jgi:sortase A
MKRDVPYNAGARLTNMFGGARGRSSAKLTEAQPSARVRILWTLGNLFMLIGVVLLVYVGGIYVQADYDRYAARGDTDLPAPVAVSAPADEEPAPFTAPVLNADVGTSSEGQVVSAVPDSAQLAERPAVTRVAIPSIGVDSKVVEVGWDVEQQGDQQVAIWQVAKYAVGQHRGSANPGQGGNVVLAGHVGGYGKVFKDLFYVKPGDQITLYSNGQQYLYTVQQRLLVTEEGVSAEQHAANAQLIAPTDHEVVTMVTCWPAQGRDKFTQRVVVQAVPFTGDTAPTNGQSQWMIR